ncbi:MAG: glycosyltransferase involved in cell wall biosynthesis [Urechidicola sp.]|jgi:glycosyltransferase involved in cell wall biosynthesis
MIDLKNKNILFLCSWYPSKVQAFNGNFVFKHARCLVKRNINLFVLVVCEDLTLDKRFNLEEGLNENVKEVVVYYSYPFKFLKQFYKISAYLKGLKYLKQKEFSINLIHVNVLIDAGFIALVLNYLKKIPYVITEHSSIFSPLNPITYSKFLKPLIKKTIQRSKYILPVSNELGVNMRKISSVVPYKKIPNVVDENLFKLPDQRVGERNIKFLHISSFAKLKNIDGILSVIKKLSLQRTDFSITIAGDGDLEEIKNMAKEKSIRRDYINFYGTMNETEIAKIFRLHDVFVLFSDYENLPCVLLEAQMCGMPLIATNVGGVSEILSNEQDGILIEAGDEDGLLNSLNQMIDNIDKYNPSLIRERAIKQYSEKAVTDNFIEIYKDVLNL